MKKYIGAFVFVFVCSLVGVAVAQVLTSNQAVPVTIQIPTTLEGFNVNFFVQQIATCGVLVLIRAWSAKVPKVGEYMVRLFDVFLGNPKH